MPTVADLPIDIEPQAAATLLRRALVGMVGGESDAELNRIEANARELLHRGHPQADMHPCLLAIDALRRTRPQGLKAAA